VAGVNPSGEAVSPTNSNGNSNNNPNRRVEKFGSFGTPQICLFCSDVDVAVFEIGIMDAGKKKKKDNENDEGKTVDIKELTEAEKSKLKEEEFKKKVDKWRKIVNSGVSDDDEEEEEEEEEDGNDCSSSDGYDDDGMFAGAESDDGIEVDEFGFNVTVDQNISGRTTPTAGIPSLTRKKRALCNNLLKSLSKPLRKTPYITALHIRQKARIPIINFTTVFGVEVDVGIGGLAGVDTTAYAGECVRKYGNLFSDVCCAVKLLLVQRGYDKPFTGGIGSYKLYVASEFENENEERSDEYIAACRRFAPRVVASLLVIR